MDPRYSLPEKGNPYYNRIQNGGYSKAIQGVPVVEGLSVLRNCVGWAHSRFHEIAGCKAMNLFDPVNAENIFANAAGHGLRTGAFPDPGALIVWQKGATLGGNDGAGHVAVVEAMHKTGAITTSESGYNAKKDMWTTVRNVPFENGAGYKLLGFVYQPSAVLDVKKGDRGQVVQWIQARLAARGYLRAGEIDGDFGRITLGAVCAFQLENGLKCDGIAGRLTRTALTLQK